MEKIKLDRNPRLELRISAEEQPLWSLLYLPPWKEKVSSGLLKQQYIKYIFCQYIKCECENYLFEDYRWKSGIKNWILTLWSSGRSSRERGLRS